MQIISGCLLLSVAMLPIQGGADAAALTRRGEKGDSWSSWGGSKEDAGKDVGSKDNADDKDGESGKDATSSDKVENTGSDESKASSSSTATYDGPTRKILCLHGGGGTAADFQNEGPGAIHRALGDNYELVYAQAPDGGLWMRDPPNGKGVATTEPNWASESISILSSIVQQQGPFYGILGYSQGSAFVPVFLSTVPDDTFQVALMFAGYVPTTHQGMVDKINNAAPFNNIPALVWMGGQDSIITNDMTREQATKFTTPTILRSANNGHVVPANSDPTFNQVISFINDPSAPLPPTLAPSSGTNGGKGDDAGGAGGKGSWEQQQDGSWINTETGETYGAKGDTSGTDGGKDGAADGKEDSNGKADYGGKEDGDGKGDDSDSGGKGGWEQQDDGSWINTETGETYGAKDGKDTDSKDEGNDTKVTTTAKPTTAKPTTAKPTTAKPTTAKPTTAKPTTAKPTTAKPATAKPTAPLCTNSDQWLKRRSNAKRARNCDWVAKKPSKRCKVKGKDHTVAADACPMACGKC